MSGIDPSEFHALRREVEGLRADVQGLVDAWNTARGVVMFVKWIGGAAASLAALWALIKLGFGK